MVENMNPDVTPYKISLGTCISELQQTKKRKNKQQIYQSSPQKNISPNYNKPQSDKNWLLLLCIQMYIYLHVVTIVKHIFRIIYFDYHTCYILSVTCDRSVVFSE
jgi:hypothetical protein